MSHTEGILVAPRPRPVLGLAPREIVWLTALFTCYAIAWTWLPLLLDADVPGDNHEQLNWAVTPDWGYSKHPPFPTLVLWVFEQFLPTGVPLTYFLGSVQVAMMLVAATLVARAALPSPAKWLAPLMAMTISYYTFRMHYYNHNTAMMVAYAGALYCTWRVATGGEPRWWIALGACWGLGLLSKYHMVVPIACNVAYLWTLRDGRLQALVRGILIAAVAAGIILVPHLFWLVNNDFPTFQYAATRVAASLGFFDRMDDIFRFTTHQLLRFASLGVLLGMFAWYRKRSNVGEPGATPYRVDAATRRFFAIHAWGPILLMVMLCALFGVDLQSHWGTAFLWVFPLYILATPYGERIARVPLPVIASFSVAVQVLSLLAYASGNFGGNFGG